MNQNYKFDKNLPLCSHYKTKEVSMQECTNGMIPIFEQIFNPEVCYKLAKKHRFIQRSSSLLQGHEFVKALVIPSYDLAQESLNGLCERLKEFNPEADISASGLAQRLNTQAAVSLLKGCVEILLNESRAELRRQYSCMEDALSHFTNIYLEDSTVFEINEHLYKVFSGTKRGGKKGGVSCKAQVKIDLIHNFATGTIIEAALYEGKRPDQALAGKILNIVKAGDLVIRDLGYFKIEVFKKIAEAGGYFLTRLPSHLKVYLNEEDKEVVDLGIHLDRAYSTLSAIEIKAWIGNERLPVRLIAYRVPQNVCNERKRKAHKAAKEMGRQLSKAKLSLLKFSLFITNIPEEWLSVKAIGTIYRLRWEIELIFKTWKSILKIDILQGLCPYRVETLIWARICAAILIAKMTSTFMNLANKYCDGELSPVKLLKYLLGMDRLFQAIKLNKIEELYKTTCQDLRRRLLKDRRCRTTMREKAANLEAYYEWCS